MVTNGLIKKILHLIKPAFRFRVVFFTAVRETFFKLADQVFLLAGQFYRHFGQTSDDEVRTLLERTLARD